MEVNLSLGERVFGTEVMEKLVRNFESILVCF